MLEKIIALDKKLFVFLNGMGSEQYDNLWLFLTKQSNWTPLFLILLYFVYKQLGIKQTLLVLISVIVLIALTDQTCNLFKNGFQRLRPCNDIQIKTIIRIVKSSETFSFFSGHAANSSAVTLFLVLLLKKYYKYIRLLFAWPLVFGYSRIYLGLHFPTDILVGYGCGFLYGFILYILYQYMNQKYFTP